MSNILIVHAHPEPASLTSALKDVAVEKLRADGHEVKVSDLYAMKWKPLADAADFTDLVRLESTFSPVRWSDWFALNGIGVHAGQTGPAFDRGSMVIAAAAQGFGGRCAHHPAQGFKQVGFTAAIGTDNAGQSGVDPQLGRVNKRFEAGQAQLGELQPQTSTGADRRFSGLSVAAIPAESVFGSNLSQAI